MMSDLSPSSVQAASQSRGCHRAAAGRDPAMIEGWRERSRLRYELDKLGQHGELQRVLTDSGIAASDVSRLMRAHPRTPQQLAGMMRRLGHRSLRAAPQHRRGRDVARHGMALRRVRRLAHLPQLACVARCIGKLPPILP